MKKLFFLLACMVMSLVMFTANESAKATYWEHTRFDTVNNLEGIAMTIQSASPPKYTVLFTNKSKSQCCYGDQFWLEQKIDGRWYQVPTISGDHSFNSLAYLLRSGGQSVWAVDLHWLYGSLKTGEYRIVKGILDYRGPGDYDTYYFAVEFSIG